MKTLIQSALVATFISVVTLGNANAMNDESFAAWHELQHSIYNQPSVSVSVSQGVATLTGDVDSANNKGQIEKVVSNAPGVTKVINLITTNE